jgi:hypothetical protein
LYSLRQLDALEAYSNNFSGTISPLIGNWNTVLFLRLDDNEFVGPIPSEIGLMPKLRTAEFNGNKFTGSMPAEICAATGARELQKLITDCKADNTGFIELTCACCTVCCNPDGGECEEV